MQGCQEFAVLQLSVEALLWSQSHCACGHVVASLIGQSRSVRALTRRDTGNKYAGFARILPSLQHQRQPCTHGDPDQQFE
jgi:hypothetical protein